MANEHDFDDARKRYHFALAPEDHERLPFYVALLGLFENDDVALKMLSDVRREQRNPMLVLAALQLASLRGHEVLGPIYDDARRGRLEDPDGAARCVLEVLHDTPDIVRRELWRSTQTNEPGRSAVLQAVIGELGNETTDINVVDVGTSAGINLFFDQFPVHASDDGQPLTLVCEDLTPIDRSRALPTVKARIGVDPHPLDLADDDDRMWLKACLWPEQRRRHDRFDAIVKVRSSWPHATTLKGGALDRLDDALALCEPDVLTIVMNTWTAFYFTPDEQLEFFDEMSRQCAQGSVAWLSIESTMVKWPGVERDEEAHHRAASQVMLTRPGLKMERWGWCHSHGRWLERTTAL